MKCLPIFNWLTQLGLAEYCMLFEQYDGIEIKSPCQFTVQLRKHLYKYEWPRKIEQKWALTPEQRRCLK